MNNARYIDSIHLIRGVAALLVVLEHVVGRPPYNIFNQSFGFFNGLGQIGVSAFFTVSGIVLPLSLGKDYCWVRLPNFILRRLVRIEPTFLVSVVAASVLITVMSALAPNSQMWLPSLKQCALHAFYLIPFSQVDWIQPVYWTLAVEFQFYVAFGLVFPLVTRMARLSPDIAVFLCACFALIAYPANFLPQVQLLKYAPCFALGMIVGGSNIFKVRPVTIALSVGLVVAVAYDIGLSSDMLLGSGLAGIIVGIWKKPVKKTNTWVKPLWWLGTVSYSLYVSHQVIASAGENAARLVLRFNPGSLGHVLANLMPFATLAVSFLGAWLLYLLVEAPSLKLSQRLKR